METFVFEDAVSVVTGAGGGIGRAIALSLARRGGRIVVADIDQDAAEAVASEIRKAGYEAIAVATDVTQAESLERLAQVTLNAFGRVDLLCNNAGVTMRPFRALWNGAPSDFRWMMDVNYFGVVNGLLAFLPHMLDQPGRRHIVNTSSMSTLDGVLGHSMYIASKNALNGLTDSLRNELEDQTQNIGVTLFMPGVVSTRIATSERLRPSVERSDYRRVREYPRKDNLFRRAIEPEAVGEMVVRAIESDSPYCLTHEAPIDRMRERLEGIVQGHSPIRHPAQPIDLSIDPSDSRMI
ncbi:SDR family NAD(P)-dependent oxidoreductase [Arthrobacter sp. NPDC089319]|uniref:SDR family NAD(P)-dependent oxidoreductase n=1 Tax=Arthrobacter sp. NPDC089319 TaxID=3155915 RepID=UPI003442A0CA